MQQDLKSQRVWRLFDENEPCKTKPIECPDGITRLVRLPNFLWHKAYVAANNGTWKSLEHKINECFEIAQYTAVDEAELCDALETWLAYSIFKPHEPLRKASVNYRDLCEGKRLVLAKY